MNIRLLILWTVIMSVSQAAVWGDAFILTGSDFLEVDTSDYTQGNLHDNSSVDIQGGGSVGQIYASDDSEVILSGGSVDQLFAENSSVVTILDGTVDDLSVYDTAEVTLSGGSVDSLYADGSSAVAISGGAVTDYLGAWGTSIIELTGGAIVDLDAGGSSQVTFYGYGWSAAGGLSIQGAEVFGTGELSGTWSDGTAWNVNITYNAETSVVRLVTVSTPCGECKGKVSELTLRYIGTDAATVRVEQKGDKAKKGKKEDKGIKDKKGKKGGKGEKDGKGKKEKKPKKGRKGGDVSDGLVVFEGDLAEGELFQFTGLDHKGTLGTEISIFINGTLNTKIHTSCSKPIYPGMISGLFEVVEGASLEGGPLCPLDTEPSDHSAGCKEDKKGRKNHGH